MHIIENLSKNFSSPNYSIRTQIIEYIIVHFTEMTFNGALEKLIDPASKVSAHYLIKADGEIYQLVDDSKIAWHAGKSCWNGFESLNNNSIGIELDNLGDHEFSRTQMNSCIALCKLLSKKYNIPAKNFIAHSDVAPSRKIDPGVFFDWQLCYSNGLGIWHNLETEDNARVLFNFGDTGSNVKSLQMDLRKLGYEIDITGKFDLQTNFVIRAFCSKFYQGAIVKKGLAFYKNDKSLYNWDSFADLALKKLLE